MNPMDMLGYLEGILELEELKIEVETLENNIDDL